MTNEVNFEEMDKAIKDFVTKQYINIKMFSDKSIVLKERNYGKNINSFAIIEETEKVEDNDSLILEIFCSKQKFIKINNVIKNFNHYDLEIIVYLENYFPVIFNIKRHFARYDDQYNLFLDFTDHKKCEEYITKEFNKKLKNWVSNEELEKINSILHLGDGGF